MIVGYLSDLTAFAGIAMIAAMAVQIAGSAGQISIGHAAFMGIAAYAAGLVSLELGLDSTWPGVVVGAAVGLAVALLFCRLVSRLTGWFFALATLAFGQAVVVALGNVEAIGGSLGMGGIPLTTSLSDIAVVLSVVVYIAASFQNSRLGQAARAVAEDEMAAQCTGIDVAGVRRQTFALSGAIAGMAGGLFAHYAGHIEPKDLDFAHSFAFLVYAAFGGFGTWVGPVVGAAVLGTLPDLLRFASVHRYLLYGVLLLLLMIVRPRGLVPRRPVGTPLREVLVDDPAVQSAARSFKWLVGPISRSLRRQPPKEPQNDPRHFAATEYVGDEPPIPRDH